MANEKELVFERNKWATKDGVIQTWVNDIIWTLLRGPRGDVSTPPTIPTGMGDAPSVLRQVLAHNGLHGLIPIVYGEKLKNFVSQQFYDRIEGDRRRTEIYEQELHWLFGPKMHGRMAAIDTIPLRKIYAKALDPKTPNPRFITALTLWTPTLAAREEIAALLTQGGYVKAKGPSDFDAYAKVTMGVTHTIRVRSLLWDGSKNWSSDVERGIWDRAVAKSGTDSAIEFDLTDLFLLNCRYYAIDTLLGSGIELLDLIVILEKAGDSLEWSRLKQIKDQFAKPDWFWASMLAITMFEQRTGRKVELPDWVRAEVKEMKESFWYPFIESRMCWANPDARLVDFPRAHVKLAKGT